MSLGDQPILLTGLILSFVGSLLIMILLPLSVTILVPLNYGILYDNNSKQVNLDKLYTSGRYFLGLDHNFITFPRQQQVMLFSDLIPMEKANLTGAMFSETSYIYPTLIARTYEGMKVEISMTIAYTLSTATNNNDRRDQLWDIYQKFGNNWETFISLVVQSEVRNVISQYVVAQFYVQRAAIEINIYQNIQAYLKGYYIYVNAMYIQNFAFDDLFEASITQTQIITQQISQQQFFQDTVQVQADTNVSISAVEKAVRISQATALAQTIFLTKQGQATAIKKKLKIYQRALSNVQNKTLFTESDSNDSILDLLNIYLLQFGVAQSNTIHPLILPVSLQTHI